MKHAPLFYAASLVASFSACSAQVEPGYVGDPLVVMHGTVTGTTANSSVSAGLIWTGISSSPLNSFIGGESTPEKTTGTFPATFELRIFDPPPETALPGVVSPADVDHASSHVALAYIVALAASATKTLSPADIVGADLAHGVFYLDVDAAPGSPEQYWADHFHVSGTRGYHVFDMSLSDDDRLAFDVCRFANVCEDVRGVVDPWEADADAWELARCLAVSPTADVCVHARDTTLDPPACLADLVSRRMAAQCNLPLRYAEDENSDLTVTLGASIWEARRP
jgi:hypothetical protein